LRSKLINKILLRFTLKKLLSYIVTLFIILIFKNYFFYLFSEIQNTHIIIASFLGYFFKIIIHCIIDVAESEFKLSVGENFSERESKDLKVSDVFKDNEEGSSKSTESGEGSSKSTKSEDEEIPSRDTETQAQAQPSIDSEYQSVPRRVINPNYHKVGTP
jgi:hypothetical protein